MTCRLIRRRAIILHKICHMLIYLFFRCIWYQRNSIFFKWEGDTKGTAFPFHAFNRDRSFMKFDQFVDERKSNSCSFVCSSFLVWRPLNWTRCDYLGPDKIDQKFFRFRTAEYQRQCPKLWGPRTDLFFRAWPKFSLLPTCIYKHWRANSTRFFPCCVRFRVRMPTTYLDRPKPFLPKCIERTIEWIDSRMWTLINRK